MLPEKLTPFLFSIQTGLPCSPGYKAFISCVPYLLYEIGVKYRKHYNIKCIYTFLCVSQGEMARSGLYFAICKDHDTSNDIEFFTTDARKYFLLYGIFLVLFL